MLKRARILKTAQGGMAAVEFALIAPVMVALFFGLVEVCNALSAHQKVTSVASTAADLTAQATTVSTSDLNDIFAASSAIMSPFSLNNISIVVTSIAGDGNRNEGTVLWSQTNGHGTAHAVGSTITIGDPSTLSASDQGLLPASCTSSAQCTIILAEVSYNYESPYGKFIVGQLDMTDLFYSKPRRVVSVTCSDCAG
ncbi:MAG TPA: TadE/TadG family type IV pilus assembly protein [Rhizomicrobium sp.]|nr:TadE/TadG family type IV pilus assembly protein [Rhizomicrobium sp.]